LFLVKDGEKEKEDIELEEYETVCEMFSKLALTKGTLQDPA
jgi:hypothetical protein